MRRGAGTGLFSSLKGVRAGVAVGSAPQLFQVGSVQRGVRMAVEIYPKRARTRHCSRRARSSATKSKRLSDTPAAEFHRSRDATRAC